MRRRYPVILLVVLVVAIALSAALAVSDAGATTAVQLRAVRSTLATTHPTATHHVGDACATCHVNGTAIRRRRLRVRVATPLLARGRADPAGGGWSIDRLPRLRGADAHADADADAHGHGTPTPTPTPTPTDTATPTPTPSPSATDDGSGTGGVTDEDQDAEDVGFPATGYPPSDGGSTPWLLVTGAFAAGLTLLFAAWRLHPARRHN